MIDRRAALAVLAIAMVASACQDEPSPALPHRYAVYEAVLARSELGTERAMVYEGTTPALRDTLPAPPDHVREDFPTLLPETWTSYVRANRRRDTLDADRLPSSAGAIPPARHIDQVQEAMTRARGSRWRRALPFSTAPEGYVSFSNVGFDSDSTQALLHVNTRYYEGFAYGTRYLLARDEAGWSVETEALTWLN